MPIPERITLGAYQFLDVEPYPDEQFGEDAVRVFLQTPMDEPFRNHYITAILSKEAQAKLARYFLSSVVSDDDFKLLLAEAQENGGQHILAADTIYARDGEDVRKTIRDHGFKVEDICKRLKEWFHKPVVENPYRAI